MINNTEIGKEGENIAEKFLIKNNYKVLQRNWRYGHLEVDLIIENTNFVIAIEVKYRNNPEIQARELITRSKQKFLIDAMEQYINKNRINKEVRFDLIIITKQFNEFNVEHIENAFTSEW